MIELNDLIDGTVAATAVPGRIRRLYALANEALELETWLEDLPQDDEKADRVWERACRRTARRIDALETALQEHNIAEVMVCGL